MTQYAFNTYTGNGSTTEYSISFSYIDSTHVKCFLDGVETSAFTISSSTVTFNTAPTNSSVIRIERQTPVDSRLVDFQDGSVLTEAELDMSANQNFYAVQEITDDQSNNLGLTTADVYDANNKRIINVADPVNNTDAVNKQFISTNLPNITTVSGIASDVTDVANIASDVTDVANNETNINTVSGQISPTNNISTLAGINSQITNVANNNADISTVAGQISPTNNISTLAGLDTELSAIYNIRTNITNVDTNSPNVNLVAGQISPTNNISTLATLDTELSAIYGIRNNITNVDTNSTNINLVAGQISPTNNINTLGNLSSELTTLGALNTEITNLNNIRTDISGVNAISSEVQTVAGLNTEISNLNTIRTDITAVANISTDIQDVQDKIAELQTVANDLNEVTSEIETVAGSIANVDAVGADLLGANNIQTVANNLSSVNSFANTYLGASATAPTLDPDGSALDLGDLYFDSSSDTMKVYSSGGWINAGSAVNGTANRFKYTATASQTTFTGADDNTNTLAFDPPFLDVYLNGIRLVNGSDFTATSGSSIVLTTGASVNDILEIVAFGTFSLSNFSITDANDVPALGSAGQVLQVNSGATALEFGTVDLANLNADNLTSGTVSIDRLGTSGTKDATTFLRGDNTFAVAGSPSIDDNGTATAITINSSQNVGIGTSAPTTPLEVNGVVRVNEAPGVSNGSIIIDALATGNPNLAFQQAGTYKGYIHYIDASDTICLNDGSGNGFHYSPTLQRVGIGNNAPSATLDVTGTIYASGRVAKNTQAWSTYQTSPETLTNLVLDATYSTWLFTIIGTSNDSSVQNKGLYFLTRTNAGYSFATIQNSGGGTLSHSSGTLTFASPTSTFRTWRASLLRLH